MENRTFSERSAPQREFIRILAKIALRIAAEMQSELIKNDPSNNSAGETINDQVAKINDDTLH